MPLSVQRSLLQQLTRSLLQQRGGVIGGAPSQWFEGLASETVVHVHGADVNPPPPIPGPGASLLEVQSLDWSAIRPTGFEVVWPDQGLDKFLVRTHDDDAGNSERQYTSVNPFGPVWPNTIGTSLKSDAAHGSVRVYPSKPSYRSGSLIINYLGQTAIQASFWVGEREGGPAGIAVGGGGVWASSAQVYRARYKWNISSAGFMIAGDIWARRTTGDTFGFDNYGNNYRGGAYDGGFYGTSISPTSYIGASRFSLEGASLYRPYTATPADTFIEVPIPSSDTSPTSFQNGFIGRGIFAIDFETPEQFVARTGISVSGV